MVIINLDINLVKTLIWLEALILCHHNDGAHFGLHMEANENKMQLSYRVDARTLSVYFTSLYKESSRVDPVEQEGLKERDLTTSCNSVLFLTLLYNGR